MLSTRFISLPLDRKFDDHSFDTLDIRRLLAYIREEQET